MLIDDLYISIPISLSFDCQRELIDKESSLMNKVDYIWALKTWITSRKWVRNHLSSNPTSEMVDMGVFDDIPDILALSYSINFQKDETFLKIMKNSLIRICNLYFSNSYNLKNLQFSMKSRHHCNLNQV